MNGDERQEWVNHTAAVISDYLHTIDRHIINNDDEWLGEICVFLVSLNLPPDVLREALKLSAQNAATREIIEEALIWEDTGWMHVSGWSRRQGSEDNY